MSENDAKSWLNDHANLVPALETYHRQALEILHSETATRSDLADIIALDPGMSISLYNQINRKLNTSKRPKHETIHGALGLLGEDAVTEFITTHTTLPAFDPGPELHRDYHQLISQGHHLMVQLVRFVEIQGMQPLNEIRSAAVLHNVGELAACLFDFDLYRDYKINVSSADSSITAAKSTFGFTFNDLGKLLARQWRLPDLVAESLNKSANVGRNARLIQLAANISLQAESGWNHDAMKSAIEVGASFLNQPLATLQNQVKRSAVESARNFAIADVIPAAARLILLPDVEKQPGIEIKPVEEPVSSIRPSLQDRIKSLTKSADASQSGIIKLLVDGLHDDLQFSRVAMVLISKDGSALTTGPASGLSDDSSFHKLSIKTANSGLFKSLMLKPQALWVSTANYKKFDALLPGQFKATCLCENFFLMSLFVGNSSIGFIYCDRSTTANNLDEAAYAEFKSCALLTTRALTYVARRDSKITA